MTEYYVEMSLFRFIVASLAFFILGICAGTMCHVAKDKRGDGRGDS